MPDRAHGDAAAQRDYTNPTVLAVELTEMRGRLAFLGQGMGEVKSAVHDLGEQISTVISSQNEFRQHSSGLERVGKEIAKYFSDNDEWKKAHVADNQKVADQVTHWRGWILGVMVMVGVLSAAVVTMVRDGFGRTDKDIARIEKKQETDVTRLEKSTDLLRTDVREIQETERLK